MAERLSGKQVRAATLVADGTLPETDVAREVGINPATLWRWKQQPEFATRVADLVKAYEEAVKAEGIANRKNRVAAQNDRWRRMTDLLAARASDPSMAGVTGGETGLLVRQVKLVKVFNEDGDDGPRFLEVEEFAVDTGLLKEFREHEKLTAQELGQWQSDKVDTAGKVVIREYAGFDLDKV